MIKRIPILEDPHNRRLFGYSVIGGIGKVGDQGFTFVGRSGKWWQLSSDHDHLKGDEQVVREKYTG